MAILEPYFRYNNSIPTKMKNMKKILAIIVLASLLASCSRSVTPYEAANRHYSHCRPVR